MRIVEMVRNDIKNSSLLKTKFLIYAFNGRTEKKIANYLRKVRKAVAGKPFKYGNRGCKS